MALGLWSILSISLSMNISSNGLLEGSQLIDPGLSLQFGILHQFRWLFARFDKSLG